MLKYREETVSNRKNFIVSSITPIGSPRDQLRAFNRSQFDEMDEFNETIPRMPADNNILNLGSSKEISEFQIDKIKQYKHEIEALNIENHSLKKTIQNLRSLSPQSPQKPSSYKRTLTSVKSGTGKFN